jgi:predicted esterase
MLALLATSCVGGSTGSIPKPQPVNSGTASGSDDPARLTARPRQQVTPADAPAGLRELERVTATPTYLFVPPGYRADEHAPFVLALHGAGGHGGRVIRPLMDFARESGAVLLAPSSTDTSWDLVRGGVGPDVASIQQALRYVFGHYAIDLDQTAVYGFSDGASYALSLGITNGDLFGSVIALSPGGLWVGTPHGEPKVFVAHGANDRALPIESTSDVIVPRLRDAGYQVTYRRHPGGHDVPPRQDEALSWLTDRWRERTTR